MSQKCRLASLLKVSKKPVGGQGSSLGASDLSVRALNDPSAPGRVRNGKDLAQDQPGMAVMLPPPLLPLIKRGSGVAERTTRPAESAAGPAPHENLFIGLVVV